MKFLQTSIGIGLLMWFYNQLETQTQKIECLWVRENLKHQINVKARVDKYYGLPLSLKNCRLKEILSNNKGSLSLVAILFLILAITLCWTTLAKILDHRKSILEREQMISCIAFLETNGLRYEKKMEKLNHAIKVIRVSEIAAASIPSQQVHLAHLNLAKRVLQYQQQLLTFRFATQLPKAFNSCSGPLPIGLILHQNQHLILKRDPWWHTTQLKLSGKTFLWSKNFKAMISFQREENRYRFYRTFYEGQTVFKRAML